MKENRILLAHGGGGTMMHNLIGETILGKLGNPILNALGDSAVVQISNQRIAFTTDSFVVRPLFFNGGDIGKLAVCGTVNDLAMAGARPLFLSLGFIIEEGLEGEVFERVVDSIREAAAEARVMVVTGDTKVVEKGKADGLFINTSGIGVIRPGVVISAARVKAGDVVLINGDMGDHGIAVISKREGLSFETEIASDCAPLNHLVSRILDVCEDIHFFRDPTRGGVAATLNEVAEQAKVKIELFEKDLPVNPRTRAACDMLGFDPLYVPNEGKTLVICHAEDAEKVLAVMREDIYGRNAAIIGRVTEEGEGIVLLHTKVGGKRIIDMPYGEQLPRIC